MHLLRAVLSVSSPLSEVWRARDRSEVPEFRVKKSEVARGRRILRRCGPSPGWQKQRRRVRQRWSSFASCACPTYVHTCEGCLAEWEEVAFGMRKLLGEPPMAKELLGDLARECRVPRPRFVSSGRPRCAANLDLPTLGPEARGYLRLWSCQCLQIRLWGRSF